MDDVSPHLARDGVSAGQADGPDGIHFVSFVADLGLQALGQCMLMPDHRKPLNIAHLYLRERWFAFLSRPDALNPSFRMATQEHVRWAKSKGYRLYVWTVDEEPEMRRLIALGVDGIITNKPDLLRQVLARS